MSKQKKAMLIILLLSMVIIAVYLYETYQLKKDINRLDMEIRQEKELVALIDSQLKVENQQLLNNEAKNVYNKVPISKGYPQLTQFFDKIADNNNVAINSIDFDSKEGVGKSFSGQGQTGGMFNTIPIRIKATADNYEAIRAFIEDIHNNDRLMIIRDFQLAEINGKITSDLIIEVYYAESMKRYIPDLEPVKTYQKAERINPISN